MDAPDPKKSAGIKGFLKGLKSGLQSFKKVEENIIRCEKF